MLDLHALRRLAKGIHGLKMPKRQFPSPGSSGLLLFWNLQSP